MENLKKPLGPLGQGFTFGIGFFLAALLAAGLYNLAQPIIHGFWHGNPHVPPGFPEPNTERIGSKDMVISNVDVTKVGTDRVFFTGIVTNKGGAVSSSANIEVILFKNKKFVDQYSSYLPGSIAPGESRYFKIACGCKEFPPVDHDDYKIQFVGGF